jgi:hypothetical protein
MFHVIPLRRALGASLVLALALWPVPATAGATVHIDNLSYEADRHSVVLAISGPVTITTRSLRSPARLVVDLPLTTLMSKNRELVIGDKLVKRVRLSQFKIIPPTVRVVIETAGDEEPIIAVQQTAKNLYITVAAPGGGEAHDDHDGHQHGAPAPTPMATPTAIAPSPVAPSPIAPSPIVPSVRPTPSPTPSPKASLRPTPSPAATPSPVVLPSPVVRPSPTPRPVSSPLPMPRSGELGGEAGYESLPGVGD